MSGKLSWGLLACQDAKVEIAPKLLLCPRPMFREPEPCSFFLNWRTVSLYHHKRGNSALFRKHIRFRALAQQLITTSLVLPRSIFVDHQEKVYNSGRSFCLEGSAHHQTRSVRIGEEEKRKQIICQGCAL